MSAIVEKNENENVKLVNLKEGMTASGLWYVTDEGEQGFVPRAKKDDNFNLTEEQHVLKEKWIKEIKRDYPNVDESTIDFICSFYLKDPKEYEELVKKNKNKESRYEKGLLELQKQYGNSDQQNQQLFFNNLITDWNINNEPEMLNKDGLELFDYKYDNDKFDDISNN